VTVFQLERARLALAVLVATLAGCTGIPSGLRAVEGFEPARYLGTWYEVARLDHSFERGLAGVTAEYSRAADGSLEVVNRGWDVEDGEWDEVRGRATFQGPEDVASLSVVFFWPFYGGYHVLALDPDYRWALVCGPDRGYLWLLAREPTLPAPVRDDLVRRAREWGFAADELIWVQHPAPAPEEARTSPGR
jgi:apolipoprotein D and lipocalin family protein